MMTLNDREKRLLTTYSCRDSLEYAQSRRSSHDLNTYVDDDPSVDARNSLEEELQVIRTSLHFGLFTQHLAMTG